MNAVSYVIFLHVTILAPVPLYLALDFPPFMSSFLEPASSDLLSIQLFAFGKFALLLLCFCLLPGFWLQTQVKLSNAKSAFGWTISGFLWPWLAIPIWLARQSAFKQQGRSFIYTLKNLLIASLGFELLPSFFILSSMIGCCGGGFSLSFACSMLPQIALCSVIGVIVLLPLLLVLSLIFRHDFSAAKTA